MNTHLTKNNIKKFDLFKKTRVFFIEQLLGILQFNIKKGLKKKIKKIYNNSVLNKFKNDQHFLFKFNKKITRYKEPYKLLTKRKKKWKRRYFSIKQPQQRLTPFLKETILKDKFKNFYKKRPQNYLMFLNSKEQIYLVKKLYLNLTKSVSTNKFENTLNKQFNYFLSLKDIKSEKPLSWVKRSIKEYINPDINNLNKSNLNKKLFNLSLQIRQTNIKTLRIKKQQYNFINLFKKVKQKNLIKLNTLNKNKIEKILNKKQFYNINNYYELNIYSNNLNQLIKVKKICENWKNINSGLKLSIKPIKKKSPKLTLLKSPHVNKTARSQFILNIFKLSINVYNLNKNKKKLLNFIIKLKLFSSFLNFTLKKKFIKD